MGDQTKGTAACWARARTVFWNVLSVVRGYMLLMSLSNRVGRDKASSPMTPAETVGGPTMARRQQAKAIRLRFDCVVLVRIVFVESGEGHSTADSRVRYVNPQIQAYSILTSSKNPEEVVSNISIFFFRAGDIHRQSSPQRKEEEATPELA